MVDLNYTKPDAVKAEIERRFKTQGGGGQNWLTDQIYDGLSVDADGDVQRKGLAYYLQPFTNNNYTDSLAGLKKDYQDAKKVDDLIQGSLAKPKDIAAAADGQQITTKNVDSITKRALARFETPAQASERRNREELQGAQIKATQDQTQIAKDTLTAQNKYQMAALQSEERKDLRNQENLAQQRMLTAQTNQMQLGFQYAQLAQQETNRREDRQEKALLAILSGVKNLGQAFLI